MSTRADWTHLFARRQGARGGEELAAILAGTPPGVLPLTGGFPNPATFATDALGEIAARVLREEPGLALQYTPVEGIPGVREYLAERQEALQGRRPHPPELMVTSGGMECIALACAAMLEPGDAVAVEGPTYLGALMAFRGAEADVQEIPMDEDGLIVDALEERLADGLRPKLLYVIPEYQNPTGRTLPLERREALVELCRRHGVLILEDVAYRELAWGAEPLPSLWSLAPDAVVQAGTFSKVFFPGVRLGWAAGPEEVVAQLAAAKANTDQCASALAPADGRGVRPRRALRPRAPAGARALRVALARARRRAARAHARRRRVDRAHRRLPHLGRAPRAARRARAARRGHRGRGRLRPGRAVLRLGRRRQRAAASFSALGEADLAEAGAAARSVPVRSALGRSPASSPRTRRRASSCAPWRCVPSSSAAASPSPRSSAATISRCSAMKRSIRAGSLATVAAAIRWWRSRSASYWRVRSRLPAASTIARWKRRSAQANPAPLPSASSCSAM